VGRVRMAPMQAVEIPGERGLSKRGLLVAPRGNLNASPVFPQGCWTVRPHGSTRAGFDESA